VTRWLDSDVTTKLATGTYVTPEAGLITVEAVYDAWSGTQVHLAPTTAALRSSTWITHVKPQWGNTSVVEVNTSEVRAWISKMVDEEIGVPTVHKAYGLLRQVLGVAMEDHRIPRNPCDGVKLPKSEHVDRGYLSHAQVAALADAVDHLPEVIRFLAYTGLRWGEMAALRVQDFDMLRRRVSISRSASRAASLGPPWRRENGPAFVRDPVISLMP